MVSVSLSLPLRKAGGRSECPASALALAILSVLPPPTLKKKNSSACRAVSSKCASHPPPFRHRFTSLNPPALGFRTASWTAFELPDGGDSLLSLSVFALVSAASKLMLYVGAPQLSCITFEVWWHLKLLGAEYL